MAHSFISTAAPPIERPAVGRVNRATPARGIRRMDGLTINRAARAQGLATLSLSYLTIKSLNNIARAMTDDCLSTPGSWRTSPLSRDPIGLRLKTISILTRQIGRKIGESLGVNVTDMAALEQLLGEGPMTPGQLAEHLKVTTAAATQIVDRLERAGHVTRQRQADDRRKICVVPLEASIDRAFVQLAPMLDGLDRVIASLSPAERQVIEGFLGQVADVYHAVAELPPPAPEPH